MKENKMVSWNIKEIDGGHMNNRRRRVADVALKLFVENGFQQTSIQDIIEHANISKGTFYNYFSNKNDCIAEILEGLRYDASQIRMEMQVGKDETDRAVLIDQISILTQLNKERNLNTIFESILNSNEVELKKMVMHHRIHELEWLAGRFVEVYGEEVREYGFELSILFYGMMHYIIFTIKITNSEQSIHRIVEVVLTYLEAIIPVMKEKGSSLLDPTSLHFLQARIDRKVLSLEELLDLAKNLEKEATFTTDQQDLYDTIVSELQRDRIRKSVLQPLTKPFQQSFVQTEMETQVNTFTNFLWYFIRMH
ncbi:TetR/AcrR family transcriptional regulator [Fredinandcohnia sp. QZ13]|uniref:TetR/AcrR family transcriptional regulator n=1 Tax=Fredinandcohnia sp. QZ13 TaxID=3073144 RepID=UPI0028536C1C|nr:TetR/AcrR family transcriptional regulator [Fredinandcohnia sp. QZ13]MDR4888658.1 TetR/AcrR family transcriptional regulator [Fredinandcohnia sp. QZ13]